MLNLVFVGPLGFKMFVVGGGGFAVSSATATGSLKILTPFQKPNPNPNPNPKRQNKSLIFHENKY